MSSYAEQAVEWLSSPNTTSLPAERFVRSSGRPGSPSRTSWRSADRRAPASPSSPLGQHPNHPACTTAHYASIYEGRERSDPACPSRPPVLLKRCLQTRARHEVMWRSCPGATSTSCVTPERRATSGPCDGPGATPRRSPLHRTPPSSPPTTPVSNGSRPTAQSAPSPGALVTPLGRMDVEGPRSLAEAGYGVAVGAKGESTSTSR